MMRNSCSQTLQQAEHRYLEFRNFVYKKITEDAPGIKVKGIRHIDCVTANAWKTLPHDQHHREKRGTWDWCVAYSRYRNVPNRFEITLWSGANLCALSYGQTSKGGGKLRLDLIESTPILPTPLGRRALPIIVSAATLFAQFVNASELWVINPDIDFEHGYLKEGFGKREPYQDGQPGQRMKL